MKLTISVRNLIYLAIVLSVLWLIYLGRGILPPFILAAGFAYILNPLVRWLSEKTKLPRIWTITIIYLGLVGGLIFAVVTLGARFAEESESFSSEARGLLHSASLQIGDLPHWLQPVATDLLSSARNTFLSSPRHFMTILPGIVNGSINILVFLIAAFYFLKDGHRLITGLLDLLPGEFKEKGAAIIHQVNRVLGDYLRAQLLLVVIMSTFTFIGLTIMGVRYSLVLGIFTGFAEIVPFVGPVIAASLAMIVAYTDGVASFGLDPIGQIVMVAVFYTILRQLEDYFIIPNILGRMIKLHPLVVLFSVLLGGHLAGVLGVILAVPFVASLKVVLEHVLNLVDHKKALQDS